MRLRKPLWTARVAGIGTALALAGLLSLGSAKKKQQTTPPPVEQPTEPSATPRPPPVPPAKTAPPVVAGRVYRRPRRAPRLPRIHGELPGGVFHGYMWWTLGSDRCKSVKPSGSLKVCAVSRGQVMGCGDRITKKRRIAYCLRGVHRMCAVDRFGRIWRCDEKFSGWSLTHHRGLIRRCCIRNGRLVTCTSNRSYICTDADRRSIAAARRRERLRRERLRRYRSTRTTRTYRTTRTTGRGAYYKCRIFNGQVSSCFGWYHGNAVVLYRGTYQMCRIFNGQVSSCRGWYKGRAPAFYRGSFQSCDIFNGRISFCRGWYRGQAAVWRNR